MGTNGSVAVTAAPASPPGRTSVTGTASNGSTTTLADTTHLTAADGTYIGYQLSVPSDSSYIGTVTGYVQSTHTLTITPAASASTSGDGYTLTPAALVTSYGYLWDNVQTITVPSSFSSTYTLTFNSHTTASIASTATPATIETDLAALTGVGSGNVAVTEVAVPTPTPTPTKYYTVRFMGSLAGAYQSPITTSSPSVTAVETIPGGDAGAAHTVTDLRGIVSLTDRDLAGETVSTIAAFSTGVPANSTDQLTAYTFDGNGDQLTQTALEPAVSSNQTTQYDFGVTGTAGTNLISNDLLAETQFPNTSTGYASTSSSAQQTYGYDLQGDKLSFKDQNGSIHTYTLDAVGREVQDAVTTLGTGVNGNVRRLVYSFTDAGLPYQQTSYNASSGGTVVNQEQDAYNGLQQLTTQYEGVSGSVNTSSTASVGYNYNLMADGQNNSRLSSVVYPNARVVDYDYANPSTSSGLGQEPVTGISVSSTTATVTTAAHGLSTSAQVDIEGSSVAALNGVHTITFVSSTQFSFTVPLSTASDTASTDMTETPISLDDIISRPDGLQDHAGSAAGTVLQGYTYLGLGTIVQENDGNGTKLTYIAPTPTPTPTPSAPPTTIDSAGDRYTGLDRFGRIVFQNWYATSTGTQTEGDQYGYDNDGNVLFDSVVNQGSTAAGYSQLYHASSAASGDDNTGYDPLGRLTAFLRGTLSASGNNTYTSAPLDTITNANINTVASSDETYTLDTLGNWTSSAAGAGTGSATAPTLTSTSRTNNSQNEDTGVGTHTLTFDNDGNTTTDQTGTAATYDAWGRQMTYGGSVLQYSYLPGSDRAIKTVCSVGTVDSYYSIDMQDVEDGTTNGCGATTASSQYVWGLDYVNHMVERDDNSTTGSFGLSSSGLGVRLYPQQDANYNIKTLTSNGGLALEHFDYDPYGNAKILTNLYATSATAFGSDTYNWIYGFQGGRYDTTTGLYHFGARDYSPVLGRWMEQDPAGYVDGGNRYISDGDNPTNQVDPIGLASFKIGTTPPPNPYVAEIAAYKAQYNTWATKGAHIWIAQEVGLILANVGGGWAKGFPHAADGLSHFIGNSGTPFDVDLPDFIHQDPVAMTNRNNDINAAISFIEAHVITSTNIVQTDNTTFKASTPDWNSTVNQTSWYTSATGISRDMSKNPNCFSMTFQISLRDYYKWIHGSKLTGGYKLVDGDMAKLHMYGVGQDYPQYGNYKVKVSWCAGQRVGAGAKVYEPWW